MPYSRWHKLLADSRYSPSSGMLKDYLKLCEGMESPTSYHVWSLISLFAALAGNRIYIDRQALGRMRLNMGIILMGFPAVRKSTAIDVMERFSQGLPLQYGPTDTAGQRQGIMAAMMPRWQYDSIEGKDEFELSDVSLDALANLDTSGVFAALPAPRVPAASELYFASSELGRLLSSQSRELIDFFTDALDGKSFYYQLKTQSIRIRNPLINLLGATTPGSLAQILPRGATEHGFLSRLIFVYAEQPATRNPYPVSWQTEDKKHLKESMLQRIEHILDQVDGPLTLTENASRTYENAYLYRPAMQDVRFSAYMQRRSDHLLKLSAILALMNGAEQNLIRASDVRLANGILSLTEARMERSFIGLSQELQSKVYMAAAEVIEGNLPAKTEATQLIEKLAHLGSRNEIRLRLSNLTDLEKLKEDGVYLDHHRVREDKELIQPTLWYKGADKIDDFVPMTQSRGNLHAVQTAL